MTTKKGFVLSGKISEDDIVKQLVAKHTIADSPAYE
jgi:hypothetical protein